MKYPITPDYLSNVSDYLVGLFESLEDYLITTICEQLNATGQLNASALEIIRQLQRGGLPLAKIEAQIRKVTGLGMTELDRIFDEAVAFNNEYYDDVYDKMGLVYEDAELDQLAFDVDAIRRQTADYMRNLTQSMGFGMRGMDGGIVISDVQDTYQRILDKAAIKVTTGTVSYNEAIRDGIREMTASGLIGEWVEYADESGRVYHRNRVDVAVRRAVMTGVSQISSKYTEQAAQDVPTPYREVSAHRGARDKGIGWQNHKAWQGKVYSLESGDKYPSIYTVCGWGEVDGLEGANCRHMHYPFWDGISERTYTDDELKNIDPPPTEYQGRKYTAYEATQEQRKLERAIRAAKRRREAFKAAGDTEAYTAAKARVTALYSHYEAFSKAAGLPLKMERTLTNG